MAGTAVTINILTMAAIHTLGIEVYFASAFLLSVVAVLSAVIAFGIARGITLSNSWGM